MDMDAISIVVVRIMDGDFVGRGECFPHTRYYETVDNVSSQIEVLKDKIASR